MNQISQYFGKNPKRRHLSDGLKTGDDDSKKRREGNSGSYTDEADLFKEGVESAACRKILFDCLKNLEQRMNDNSNKEMQIKGNKQLIDLTSSVEFSTTKFDELKTERKSKFLLLRLQ